MAEQRQPDGQSTSEKATCLCGYYLPENPSTADVKNALTGTLDYFGKSPETASSRDWYMATATVLRNRLLPLWMETLTRRVEGGLKFGYYLSIEYLLGRQSETLLAGAGLSHSMPAALRELGQNPEVILNEEPDPALGNGGLGRLAACFMDSGACLHLPVIGYGLYYEDGLFTQEVDEQGRQIEKSDQWEEYGNPWNIVRDDRKYYLSLFDGAVTVEGVPHDMPVPSYDGKTVNTLRLWKTGQICASNPDHEGIDIVNQINKKLYPPDENNFGKNLRFTQEYFMASMSVQDIVARHLRSHASLENLADTAAIHLNDTHPAVAVPELMRVLMDEHGMQWNKAKEITRSVCFYTNHTLMPEALEHWSEGLVNFVAPRILQITRDLNADLMRDIDTNFAHLPSNERNELKDGCTILKDGQMRMGHLSAAYSGNINGVSEIHSRLVKERLFPAFVIVKGKKKFSNITNGITPRRWLVECNPELAALITRTLKTDAWITDLVRLDDGLKEAQNNPEFREQFHNVKQRNKLRFGQLVKSLGGPSISPDALIDVQVKRIHEYKRQFLNVLHTAALYREMIITGNLPEKQIVKVFSGKAAPSYFKAKNYITLINDMAMQINADRRIQDRLKIFFIKDYNVSKAGIIIPAANLSEQISTAGTEASGTSNMKFALNGALTMGTRDGANIEIGSFAGEENIFFFGHTVEELDALRVQGYDPQKFISGEPYVKDRLINERFPLLHEALEYIANETAFSSLADDVRKHGDHWMLAADFGDYWEKQKRAHHIYMRDRERWLTMSIANTRAGAHFSSDDTFRQYAQMWGIKSDLPILTPGPDPTRPVHVRADGYSFDRAATHG